MSGDDYLNSIRLPRDVEDRRVAGDPLTVGPLDVRLPRWLLGLTFIPMLTACAGLIWFVFRRILPAQIIRRQDNLRGSQVQLRLYDHMQGPDGAFANLAVSGARSFAFDKTVSLPVGDQRVIAERFRVIRLASSSKPRARIEYQWRGQRDKYNADLVAGSQKPLKGLPPEAGRMVVMLSEFK
jgi:hypothetical protein